MPFDRQSDYALNKKTEDLVYVYANGESDVYTKEKDPSGAPTGRIILKHKGENGSWSSRILRNDEMGAEQFDALKIFSDNNLHEIDKSDVREYRNTVPLDELGDLVCEPEEDDPAEDAQERKYKLSDAIDVMDGCLTPVQKRRMMMYYYDGMTMDKIAAAEGVKRHPVWKSIRASDKKVKKYIEKEKIK